ncbi:MAG TPA: MotA/TolQ/ExbB proton channel family protein [Bryobacteraceae bacterium]|nr:MotA/TolQ/ExbB proton channel family protein [Bryobacteraceae bacterium]
MKRIANPRGERSAFLGRMMGQPKVRAERAGLDIGMLVGIAIASIALVAGVAVTGVSAHYFFQPTGILIVIGGTLGVMLITTPLPALLRTLRHSLGLFSAETPTDPNELVEEIVSYAKIVRIKGLLAIEPNMDQVSHSFLREALMLAMDTKERGEVQSDLENKMRHAERQSEAAAKVLDVAGGFAPTIGVMGTVVGLIDVLRQFSSLSAVASGVGAAFTSTIYGLALANLVLLPAANRIRARAAETFDLQELMTEGALCLFDGMHSLLVRHRLYSFLNAAPVRERSMETLESALETGRL